MKRFWKSYPGEGNIYILFLLVIIMGIAYFMVGGLIPRLTQDPSLLSVVQVDLAKDAKPVPAHSTLQLTSFGYCKAVDNFQYVFEFGINGTPPTTRHPLDGIAVNSKGNVYLSVQGKRVQIFTRDGKYIRDFGPTNLSNVPYELATGPNDNVYIADSDEAKIHVYTSNGDQITSWGTRGQGAGQFNLIRGIAVDTTNNVYVTDAGSNRIHKFSSNGAHLLTIETYNNQRFNNPSGMHVDSGNNLIVADFGNRRIVKFDSNGKYIWQKGSPGTGPEQFSLPDEIAIDENDNIFVTDVGNNRIQIFDKGGNFKGMFGKAGNGKSEFSGPWSIDVDNRGRVFVSDVFNNRVQAFDRLCEGETIITKPTVTPTIVAVTQPPTVCTAGKLATLLIVDRSNSITGIKNAVKTSLESFKNRMLQSSGNNAFSMVSFAGTATSDIPLNKVSVNGGLLSQRIDNFVTAGGTSFPPTFPYSRGFINDVTRNYPGYKQIIVIVSDGKFSFVAGAGNLAEAQAEFIRDANQIKNTTGVDVYFVWISQTTIPSVNITALTDLPLSNYLVSVTPTASNLTAKLDQIFEDVCN